MANTKITSANLDTLTTLTVDNITIDGQEIDVSSGDLTIDVAGGIVLDADDSGTISFKDGGTRYGLVQKASNNFEIQSMISDGDLVIKGNDGGSTITALTLDMSNAGKATFNSDIVFGGTGPITSATNALKAANTGENGFFLRTAVSTAGNPSYSNVDDTNTGMFLPGSDVIGLTTGGSERMRIDASGNLGIGDQSPDNKLHVNSGTTNVAAKFESTDGTTAIQFTDNGGSAEIGCVGDDVVLFPNGSEKFRVQNSTGYLIAQSASQVRLVLGSTGNSSNNTSNWIRGTGNELGLNSAGGNVGIEIGGSAKVTVNPTGQILANPLGVTVPTFSFIGDTNTGMTRPTGDTLQFVTGGSERMRITSGGKLAIGTTGLNNSFVSTGIDIEAGTSPAITMNRNSDGDIITFKKDNGTGTVGGISITSTATSFNTSSDARLKDVTGEARGLEVINELNPVSYNWKADGKSDEGLIAQEVMEIVPNAVSGSEEDMYQMDYSKLVTPLIKAVQELSTTVDQLKAEITTLKGE